MSRELDPEEAGKYYEEQRYLIARDVRLAEGLSDREVDRKGEGAGFLD